MDGSQRAYHHVPDEEQPTERTALLGRDPSRRNSAAREDQGQVHVHDPLHPPIEAMVARLQEEGLPADHAWCPIPSPSTERTAFILVTLLQLRAVEASQASIADDAWEEWSREEHAADLMHTAAKRIREAWADFLSEARTSEEVEDVLWMEFYLSTDDLRCVRVVDFLAQTSAPEELVSDHVVLLSLAKTWRTGRTRIPHDATFLQRLSKRYSSLASPRAVHLLDLIIYAAFIATLAHYSLAPPSKPIEAESARYSIRAIFLIIYSVARLCEPWTITAPSFIFVVLAFASSLPVTPYPDDGSYSVLLIALSLHVLQLQIPYAPGPLHLFPAEQALPIAVLIWHGVSRVFFPVVTFFLPGLLLTLFLLSTSLSDTLFQPFVLFTVNPSPMEARTAFLLLFAILFILLLCSLLVLALVYPSITFGPPLAYRWDRYSRPIGLEARRTFIRTILSYSTTYPFVTPFNLLEIIFVRLPALFLRGIGQKHREASLKQPTKIIWMTFVGPLILIASGVWLWGFTL